MTWAAVVWPVACASYSTYVPYVRTEYVRLVTCHGGHACGACSLSSIDLEYFCRYCTVLYEVRHRGLLRTKALSQGNDKYVCTPYSRSCTRKTDRHLFINSQWIPGEV